MNEHEQFPAIFIGGPPGSGKSTLADRLSRALHGRSIAHRLFRASPDGEGAWRYLAPEEVAKDYRKEAKFQWTKEFAQHIAAEIAGRKMPLLVDAGGKVTPENELIAAACTHAIIIANSATGCSLLQEWRDLVSQKDLILLADVQSELQGQQVVSDAHPVRGTITGLARDSDSTGACFDAVVECLYPLLPWRQTDLVQSHATEMINALLIDINAEVYPPEGDPHPDTPLLPQHSPDPQLHPRWQPAELPVLLELLPSDQELVLFGIAPSWIYGGGAGLNPQLPMRVFNTNLGYTAVPQLVVCEQAAPTLAWAVEHAIAGQVTLRMTAKTWLNHADPTTYCVPTLPAGVGIILNGKVPMWLFAALVRQYSGALWIANNDPNLIDDPETEVAVVVQSRSSAHPIGSLVRTPKPPATPSKEDNSNGSTPGS